MVGAVLYVARPVAWRTFSWIFSTVVVCLLLYMVGQPVEGSRDRAREAEVKRNLVAIQLGLERYAENHGGRYPVRAVIEELSFPGEYYLPENPFTEDRRLMQPVPFGANAPFGDFTYIPIEEEGEVVGYCLLAYGSERTRGRDVDGDGEGDHVIMVLSSEDGEFEPLVDATVY